MKELKLSLPTNVRNIRKGKGTQFIGLNWYRNAHHFTSNATKRSYAELVNETLKDNELVFKEYEIKAVYHYARSNSDLDNSIVITKFLNDALQMLKVTQGDDVKQCKRIVLEVGEKVPVDDARIDFTVKEFKG